jgi:hypothetical protein
MSLPGQTFADYAARRQARKGLQEGRAAINDMIATRFARSTPEALEFQAMREEKEAVLAQMDQGSRGRPPAQEPTGNEAANDALRRMFRHEPGADGSEVDGSTEA